MVEKFESGGNRFVILFLTVLQAIHDRAGMSTGRMIVNCMAFLTVPSQKLAHCKEDPIYVFPEMNCKASFSTILTILMVQTQN